MYLIKVKTKIFQMYNTLTKVFIAKIQKPD